MTAIDDANLPVAENLMTSIAFVGLGDMGSQMVPHLVRAGHRVTVFDIDSHRIDAMTDLGARAAESPAAAAHAADVVISAVMSADIPAAHLGPDGILSGMRPGAALAVVSTTTPEMLQAIASRLPPTTHLVDAPLVGGVRYAAEATLTVLLAGDDAAIALTEPILTTFGTVVRVGPLGAGVAQKLITNVAVMAAEAGLREALDLADLLGQRYETTLDLLLRGPMAAVTKRALDRDNPRALRDSAVDFDTLLAAGGEDQLPISAAGRRRLWAATEASPPPVFFDLTTHATALPQFRTNAT
ncbi:MAG: NAD(P)-binding domain-containing protein [Mycobacterium sp.]